MHMRLLMLLVLACTVNAVELIPRFTTAATGDLLQALGVTPQAVLGHSAGAALMLRMALDGRLDGAHLIQDRLPMLHVRSS